jgi:hypothetical protein
MIDTSTLNPGVYRFNAQSLEARSYARFVPIELRVVTVTNIDFSHNGAPATNLVVTNQNSFYVDYSAQTSVGGVANQSVVFTSSNPDVVLVHPEMNYYQFYAVGNGNANLTATTPDGYSKTLPVTVAIASPSYISSASSSPGVVHNGGGQTNVFFWQGTGAAPSSYGRSWSGFTAPPDYVDNTLNWETRIRTGTVAIPAGAEPGSFLYYASIVDANYSTVAQRPFSLQIVNAPERGQIIGKLFSANASGMYMQELSGDLVVYDNSGTPIKTNSIWSMTGNYRAAYLAPGTYRLQFIPGMGGMSGPMAPAWYPSGTNFAGAAPITVAAGQTVSNINFVLMSLPVAPMDMTLKSPRFMAPTHPHFDIETKAGVTYVLEYKDSMADAWKTAVFITGDGQAQTLVDPSVLPAHRIYRLRMDGE